MKNILILGAGFGGLTVANELAKYPKVNVTIIDKNQSYNIGLTKTWVAIGKKLPKDCELDYELLKKKRINFINAEVTAIDVKRKIVEAIADSFSYDYLIIALGAELASRQILGFENAYNLYNMQDAERINVTLKKMEKGRIVILICRTPFKCPPAPYEATLLIQDYLTKLKTRDRINISMYTSEPQPMPIAGKIIGDKIKTMLAEKNIPYYPNHKITEIGKNYLKFENGSFAEYDMLIAVPPHVSPGAVKNLCDESGWIPVDKNTLETKFENVYAIGDCAAIKLTNGAFLPKAGILAEEEAKVVAHNILADVAGSNKKILFKGEGYCFLETDQGNAAYAKGKFFAEPIPDVIIYEPSEKYSKEKKEFEKNRIKEWFY